VYLRSDLNTGKHLKVNGKMLKVPKNLNCKTKNAIYLWEYGLCNKENAYFGRIIHKCHSRTNGHMKCFFNGAFQKSALSMHANDKDPDNMSLENFKITIVKETSPRLREKNLGFCMGNMVISI